MTQIDYPDLRVDSIAMREGKSTPRLESHESAIHVDESNVGFAIGNIVMRNDLEPNAQRCPCREFCWNYCVALPEQRVAGRRVREKQGKESRKAALRVNKKRCTMGKAVCVPPAVQNRLR